VICATSKRLNILHVATINKPIASQLGYGPIETVIYDLDKGLHARGHRSIVACSSDSTVAGERYSTVSRSLGGYMRACTPDARAHIDLHLARALARAQQGDIDVIHMHEWFERVYRGSFCPSVPIVMTLHVPGPRSGIRRFREAHPGVLPHQRPHFVAISDYQRRQYRDLVPVAETIRHGLDVEEYSFGDEPNARRYLFHIGRITRDKGQDIALAVAKKSGTKLILAGCVQDKPEDRAYYSGLRNFFDLVVDVGKHIVDDDYFERVMKPILSSDKQIIYIGELDTAAKKHWFRHAHATLFPIRWGEPFGMVLIESMASGTPVVAFARGSVPEIVKDGETGFIVNSVEAMVQAIGRIDRVDRRACRSHVVANFSIERMTEGYEALYQRLASGRPDVHTEAGQRRARTPIRPAQQRAAIG
jgi:glycosyltransferase involved in cell wall biosynthesis